MKYINIRWKRNIHWNRVLELKNKARVSLSSNYSSIRHNPTRGSAWWRHTREQRSKTPFTRYNWLSNRFNNRLDNWLNVCLHDAAGCSIGCYTAMLAWNDSRRRRPAKHLMQTSGGFAISAPWYKWLYLLTVSRDRLRSSVRAGGGHFEHMLWNACSFVWFCRAFCETVNVIWCM